MSVSVTWNGSSYTIPQTGEVGWGTNLTNYLVALPAGALQKSGGSFTLAADVDFGATYGLKAAYLISKTSLPASAGTIRLAKTDTVKWRNSDDSGDLGLTIDAFNNLTYAGNLVYRAGSFLSSKAITTDGSGSLTASSPTTSTEIGYVSGVTSAIQTQIGTKKTVATGNAYKFETTNVSGSLQETTVTASRAVVTDANGLPSASATTATEIGYVSGLTSAIQAQINSKYATAGGQLTGNVSFDDASTHGIVGTTTNNTPASGNVGEVLTALFNATLPSTNVYADAASLSLTAGDWCISLVVAVHFPVLCTTLAANIGVSVTSGNSTTGLLLGNNYLQASRGSSNASYVNITIANYHVQLAGTTTHYVKMFPMDADATHPGDVTGRLSAVRIR